MVIMSGTATVLQQFVSGLKSRNEDTRAKSAKDLQHYVTTELREVTSLDGPDIPPIYMFPLGYQLFTLPQEWLQKHTTVCLY